VANTNDSSTGGFLSPAPAGLPPEDTALDEILQALVVGVTGLPGNLIRPRWQPRPPPVPEPSVDWCAIGITDEDPEPNISQVHLSAGQGSTISYDVDTVTVLASFYGPTARGNAKLLRTGLMIPQNRETLYNSGLALMEIPGKTVFLPEIVNNQTLRRADIQIMFRRRTTLVWPILNILEMQGTILTDQHDGDLTDPLQTPFSVNPLVE
jgi:hypothetical protein